MRTADIYFFEKKAGTLVENDDGRFVFAYDEKYLQDLSAAAISCIMPLRSEPYVSETLFPFFDGLIPEGWLLDIAEKNWKLDGRDRMGLLLACCSSSIGAVSVCRPEDTPPSVSFSDRRQGLFDAKTTFEISTV